MLCCAYTKHPNDSFRLFSGEGLFLSLLILCALRVLYLHGTLTFFPVRTTRISHTKNQCINDQILRRKMNICICLHNGIIAPINVMHIWSFLVGVRAARATARRATIKVKRLMLASRACWLVFAHFCTTQLQACVHNDRRGPKNARITSENYISNQWLSCRGLELHAAVVVERVAIVRTRISIARLNITYKYFAYDSLICIKQQTCQTMSKGARVLCRQIDRLLSEFQPYINVNSLHCTHPCIVRHEYGSFDRDPER